MLPFAVAFICWLWYGLGRKHGGEDMRKYLAELEAEHQAYVASDESNEQ